MTVSKAISICAAVALTAIASATVASAQSGPVGAACANELKQYCPGKAHGSGEGRMCLDANKAKASAACKRALETTGGGQGMGQGMGQGRGPGMGQGMGRGQNK